jgi:hypothetical protein
VDLPGADPVNLGCGCAAATLFDFFSLGGGVSVTKHF